MTIQDAGGRSIGAGAVAWWWWSAAPRALHAAIEAVVASGVCLPTARRLVRQVRGPHCLPHEQVCGARSIFFRPQEHGATSPHRIADSFGQLVTDIVVRTEPSV